MSNWQALVDHVRAEMARRGWSRKDLAVAADVSLRTLNRFFNGEGKHERQTDTIPKIGTALGWKPGTARLILSGESPDGTGSRDDSDREAADILARIMKLDSYHRRRIALRLAVEELSSDDEE
ncbi:MAG: helix-turn-helix domain-containing protein [Actinobacteria bacterium]|nr:helix-turn-helix domain-containing protein [Actinomycetota bacterium]